MENITKPTILSFSVSLLSLALFFATFYQFNILIFWIIASIASVILPFFSKYRRMKRGASGKWMEVTAFAIGAIELYIILFFGLGLHIILLDIVVLAVCVLYMVLFNKIVPESGDT